MSVSVPKGTQMQSSRWSLGVQVLLRLLRVMANRGLFRDRVARLVCWLQTKGPGQHSAMASARQTRVASAADASVQPASPSAQRYTRRRLAFVYTDNFHTESTFFS